MKIDRIRQDTEGLHKELMQTAGTDRAARMLRVGDHSKSEQFKNTGDYESYMENYKKSMRDNQTLTLACVKAEMDKAAFCSDKDGGGSNKSIEMVQNLAKQGMELAQMELKHQADKENILANKAQRAETRLGKVVEYDTNNKKFDGVTHVRFFYDLVVKPTMTNVATTIKILDKNGRIVREDNCDVCIDGENEYIWDGKLSGGDLAKKGEKYKIQVEATALDAGMAVKPKVQTWTTGVVNRVIYDKENVWLEINGKKVAFDDVRASVNKGEENAPLSREANLQLVGKNVSIDLTKLEVKDRCGMLYYNNTVKQTGSKITINLTNEKGVKSKIELSVKLGEGEGKFEITPQIAMKHKLRDGVYSATISVEEPEGDGLEGMKMTQLPTSVDCEIKSVDIRNNTVTSVTDKLYPSSSIAKINAGASQQEQKEQAKLDAQKTFGASYIGKPVTFKNNIIEYIGQDPFLSNTEFKFPEPPHGYVLQNARMVISDKDGKEIAKVTITGAALYHENAETLPNFAGLDAANQAKVMSVVWQKFGLNQTQFNAIHPIEQNKIREPIIEELFRKGEILKNGQNKDNIPKNRGIRPIKWDGTKGEFDLALVGNGGRDKADVGRYKYKLLYEEVAHPNPGGLVPMQKELDIPNLTETVKQVEVENGKIVLFCPSRLVTLDELV